MESPILTPTRRWVFLATCLLVGIPLSYFAVRNAVAERRAGSTDSQDWLRAAELEPTNPDHWYRLGRFRQLDFERSDLSQAIQYYQRAVALDPRAAHYWLDLAGAYEAAGDLTRARQAFEQAKAAYPASSDVAWRFGNFLLRQQQLAEAFAEMRRAVATTPTLARLATSRAWRSRPDAQVLLDQVLPVSEEAYLGALDTLVAEHAPVAALAVWDRLMVLQPSFALRQAFPLLDELVAQGRSAEALRVWKQALEAAGWTVPPQPPGSLLFDGGFEADFTEGGFGWRMRPPEHAEMEFDTGVRQSGHRSLRVVFDGRANFQFEHLYQRLPVEPRTRYRFGATLRTQGITTDSGIRFQLSDPQHPSELSAVTRNVTGTQDWTLDEMDFTTGPNTQVLEILFVRRPSLKLDNRISGTVWLDDLTLTPLPRRPGP